MPPNCLGRGSNGSYLLWLIGEDFHVSQPSMHERLGYRLVSRLVQAAGSLLKHDLRYSPSLARTNSATVALNTASPPKLMPNARNFPVSI